MTGKLSLGGVRQGKATIRPFASVPNSEMTKPLLTSDVEKLSRGEPTRHRTGSRGEPHRLTQRERILFEAAKRRGFLKIPLSGARANVSNIYRLWCEAEGRPCDIRRGGTDQPSATSRTG